MNEEQIKKLEDWIAAERKLRAAMRDARSGVGQPSGSSLISKANAAFEEACKAGGRAFDMLALDFGLSARCESGMKAERAADG